MSLATPRSPNRRVGVRVAAATGPERLCVLNIRLPWNSWPFPLPPLDRSTADSTPDPRPESVSYSAGTSCRITFVMHALLRFTTLLLRCLPAFFRSRNEQAIVELALRQQLAIYAQNRSRPRLTPVDRGFWVLLSRLWPCWKEALVIVQPDTVVRWHRKGFRLYWRSISKRGPGRPPIPVEVQALIRRFANENGWRTRKIRLSSKSSGCELASQPSRDIYRSGSPTVTSINAG